MAEGEKEKQAGVGSHQTCVVAPSCPCLNLPCRTGSKRCQLFIYPPCLVNVQPCLRFHLRVSGCNTFKNYYCNLHSDFDQYNRTAKKYCIFLFLLRKLFTIVKLSCYMIARNFSLGCR